MTKLNNHGYMLIEFIFATALTLLIGYYLLQLTFKFSDKSQDLYQSVSMLSDKTVITKGIMEDLSGKNITNIETDNSTWVTFEVDDENRKLEIRKGTKEIVYGKYDESSYDTKDSSYYDKKLSDNVVIGDVLIESENNFVYINIPLSTIYDDTDYSIKLIANGNICSSYDNMNLSEYIINLYNDGSTIDTVYIGGSTTNPTVGLNKVQGIMLDNNGEFRYYGADPNNYVSFNNELWRIIGVFSVEDENGNTEQRVKIIKDESIGNYSYDSSGSEVNDGLGINDWSKSDLMTELNTLYYNSESGTCYNGASNSSTTCDFNSMGLKNTARSMIGQAKFYLGGSENLGGLYADDYYNFERDMTVYNCSTDDGACPGETNWTGYVGIMYPSDYMYATDLSICTSVGNYYSDDCMRNDWLIDTSNSLWTISPTSYDTHFSYYVDSTGYVTSYDGDVYNAKEVYPTIYLKSGLVVTGGDGSSVCPYELSDLEVYN